MSEATLTDQKLRYPIGKLQKPDTYTAELLARYITQIRTLPARLRAAVIQLNDGQLRTTYRPGGWTLKQVVHHLADSHLNCLMRIKLALTQDNPTILPYDEAAWAEQADHQLPIEASLKMLEGIHQHMVALFDSFDEAQWDKTFYHPENKNTYTLKFTAALYAWHGDHHLAHITETMKQWGLA
jgi:hypothetical protein